jgi:hypothetical protein
MSTPVTNRAAYPTRVTKWGLILLGIVCLGIGLWFATGAFVDLDFMNVNHMNGWSRSVIFEMSFAVMLMASGPWCMLQGIRSTVRHTRP